MSESGEGVGERPVRQDYRLNQLARKGIFQPIAVIHNPHIAKVNYLNTRIHFDNPHFDFSRSIPPHLPYMLALGDKHHHPDALVYGRPDNRRSGLLTSAAGMVVDNVTFSYLDEKGLGLLNEELADESILRSKYLKVSRSGAGTQWCKPMTWGIANLEGVMHDVEATEELEKDGIRVVPSVAVVSLTHIPDRNGDFVPLTEAYGKELLAEQQIPVIQLRAYVTPYRAKDLLYFDYSDLPPKEITRRKYILLQALEDMSQDKTISVDLTKGLKSVPDYLDWFTKTFGSNLAKLHRNKKVHNWLDGMHNTTLDARMIDSDGLESNVSDRDINQERASLFEQYTGSPSELWTFYNSVMFLSGCSFEESANHANLLIKQITEIYQKGMSE